MARLRRPQIALLALIAALGIGYGVDAARGYHPAPTVGPGLPGITAPTTTASAASAGSVPLSALPPQVATTLALVRQGGPFPYPEDGEIFDNAEHRLPREPYGYYHAYTVPTPGTPERGERRLVSGKDGQFWYTPDHYVTFRLVDVG